jgi:uncharacterized membrane protein YgcG
LSVNQEEARIMPWRKPWRFWRHLAADEGSARRAFPAAALGRIEAAIAAGERTHRAQVAFAVEPALPLGRVLRGVAPRERALEVFGALRVWDTEENCGVLVYLLLADRDVEIVADRGVHARVGSEAWEAICRQMEAAFGERRFADGAEAGVRAINALLAAHYPQDGPTRGNELSDRPLIL